MEGVENINFAELDVNKNKYKSEIAKLQESGYIFVGARSEFPEDLVDSATKTLKPGYAVVKNPNSTEKYPYCVYMNDKLIKQA